MRIENTIVNIIFDAGKGSTPVSSREGICGERFGDLPKPSRPGYAFVGWYLNGEPVTADTVLEAEQDVRLTAMWEKKSSEKKVPSVMRKQKIMAFVLCCCILFLGIATAVANRLIAIYYLTDEYINEETGEVLKDRYTIKREDGVYKLFNRDGKLMEITENGYTASATGIRYEVYVAEASGNQYLINTSTGEYETYAVVDYDSSLGESLGGTVKNKRIMMYPRVGQDNTYSIKVKNEHGEFEFYRKNVESADASTGKKYTTMVQIKGTEDTLTTYDPTLFASLCVSTGYMLTTQKLDFSDPETPRNPDGSVRMEDYGLAEVRDAEGNLTYTPAEFTITKASFAADGKCSPSDTVYTVKVGKAILSGGGYYVQLVGRDAVYIVSPDIANTVLQPVEALVTPSTVFPMSMSTYVMVYNFRLGTVKEFLNADEEDLKDDNNVKLISAFNYVDLAERESSIFSSVPYWLTKNNSIVNGYKFNSDSVSTVLGNLYQMEYLSCVMLNPKEDSDFEKYHLDRDVFIMTFDYDPDVANGGSEEKYWVSNMLVISQLTEQGTYYIYSFLYDMIVEVDQYYLSFLEWDKGQWYNQYVFQNNICYMKKMSFTAGGKSYEFTMDNRFTYAYYDNGDGTGKMIDLTKGTIRENGDGTYTYTVTKTGKQHKTYLMDLYSGNTYRDPDSKSIVYKGPGDKGTVVVKLSESTTNLYVYSPQYAGANGSHLLDYTIEEKTMTDTGTEKTKTYTALDNFRRLYSQLLWYSIEGTVNEKNLGSDVKTYVANHEPVAEIRYSLEDMASILNPEHYEKNNTSDMVLRFYQYEGSDWKMLLTIEVLSGPDATPDPSKGEGLFYVLSGGIENIMQGVEDLLNGKLLPSTTA